MDPQQELFSRLIVDLTERFKSRGYEVYDSVLPPEDAPYPFVYLGDCQQSDTDTKTQLIGKVNQTIHIWHNNPRQRGTVSGMLADIKKICRKIEHTDSYSWSVKIPIQRIFPDTTTKTPLLHGVIEAEFDFS